MSLFQYLQLQPIEEPLDDGTPSELDTYLQDDTIDLSSETSGEEIAERLAEMTRDTQCETRDEQ